MTKEELKQEAVDWCKKKNLTPSNVGYFTADYCEQSYIASAEPREKRIAELEKENLYYKDIVETNSAEWEEQGQRVVALEKENAELKSEKGCETCAKFDEVKLTKAKDLLLKLSTCLEGHSNNNFEYELIKEAEQFISEVEK